MPLVMTGRGNRIVSLTEYLNFFLVLFDILGSGTFKSLRTELQP